MALKRRNHVHYCLVLFLNALLSESRRTETVKVLTYNTALIGASISLFDRTIPDNRVERRDALIQYLNDEANADFVCLQETWFGQDVEAIVKGVGSKFPYSYSQVHLSNGTLPPQSDIVRAPVCNTVDYTNLITCMSQNNCINNLADTLLSSEAYGCTVTKCLKEFQTLVFRNGEECLSCLIRNSPNNHIKRCAGPPSEHIWNINKIGLLLLSKEEMVHMDAAEYFPNDINIFAYGYLRAKVNKLTIGCTHIVPTAFDLNPLMPQFKTFSEQQAVELQTFVNVFAGASQVIALGDFNCGPGNEILDPIEPANYEILTSSNFTTKLTEEGTFSSYNPYNAGPDQSYNYAIDHVFSAGNARILNTEVVLKTGEVQEGSRLLPLSDHFGVKAVIKVTF